MAGGEQAQPAFDDFFNLAPPPQPIAAVPQPAANYQIQPEAQPEARPEAQPEARPEAQPAARPEAQPAAQRGEPVAAAGPAQQEDAPPMSPTTQERVYEAKQVLRRMDEHLPDSPRISTVNRTCKDHCCCSCVCGCLHLLLPLAIMFLMLALAGVMAAAINDVTAVQKPSKVTVRGGNVYVNGKPFIVKGINYSPVWAGQDAARKWPYGDHMFEPRISVGQIVETFSSFGQSASDFEDFDHFHLEKIKAAGFNTIRMYNWQLDKDHSKFLDSCKEHGLMVILTFWMDSGQYGPLSDSDQRHKAKVNFAHMLRRYKSHPQVLMWAFGNELNAASNPKGYFGQLPEFFKLCDELREIRDNEEGDTKHPIVIPIAATADVNAMLKKYDLSTGFDLWGLQPYMSPAVLNYFLLNLPVENKAVLITEYGTDSLQDNVRRRSSRSSSPARATASAAGEHTHAKEMMNLTKIMFKFLAGKTLFPICMPGKRACDRNETVSVHALPWPEYVYDDEPVNEGDVTESGYQEFDFKERGNPRQHLDWVIDDWQDGTSNLQHERYSRIAGMVLFEWMDEWWKGPLEDPDHPDCDENNEYRQSSCGFFSAEYGSDGRQNEEFFGITAQQYRSDDREHVCLRPKPAFYAAQALFGNAANLSQMAPFCNESAGAAERRGKQTVDASYLSRLRVAAAADAERDGNKIAYGTQEIPSDFATVTRWGLGDVVDAARDTPSGRVTITDTTPRLMRVNWDLTGVRGPCNSNSSQRNSCGVRIHENMTCDVDALGKHLFRNGSDPWLDVKYVPSGDGRSMGSATLDFGLRIPSAVGHAVVVYGADGAPAACGLLDTRPGWAPARGGVPRLSSVAGGGVSGAVNVTDITKKPIWYNASFRGAHGKLTMKVLSGADCFEFGDPLSFERDASWNTSTVTVVSSNKSVTTSKGFFDNGYSLADLFGRAAAVYSGAKMVACAVIRRRSRLEGYAVFGNVVPGGGWLIGTADFYDESPREMRIEWDMKHLTPNCPGAARYGNLVCTVGLTSTVGWDAEGEPVTAWWNLGVRYATNSSGRSRGSVTTASYPKVVGDLHGVSVDFRDEEGLVSARGDIKVDTEEVTVRYDGYDPDVEGACCVKAPPQLSKLAQWFEDSLPTVLIILGAHLGFTVIMFAAYRIVLHCGSEETEKQRGGGGRRALEEGQPLSPRDPDAGRQEGVPGRFEAPGAVEMGDVPLAGRGAKRADVPAGVARLRMVMEIAFSNPQMRPRGSDFSDQAKYDVTPAYNALMATIDNVAMRHGGEWLEACQYVHEVTVPEECRRQDDAARTEAPGYFTGKHCFVTQALLFLVIQQRIDGLRQCRWFKAAAFNHIVASEDPADQVKAMQEVVVVAQHHLKCVASKRVNYADVDDTYKVMFNRRVRRCPRPPIVFNRRCRTGPNVKSFSEMVAYVAKGYPLAKTFPERISWFVPLRLFSFTFHTHIVLFYAAVALNLRMSRSTIAQMLGEAEVIFCFLNFCIDLWMFPLPEFGICPSLLTVVDAVCSCIYIWAQQSVNDEDVVVPYVAWMWFSNAVVRPLGTLCGKAQRKHSDVRRFLPRRWLTLFFMFAMQVFWVVLFIAPGVSTISTSLCHCPTGFVDTLIRWQRSRVTRPSCDRDIHDFLCFGGVFGFFICTFLSLTLMAHVSYMLLSIICGYAEGIKKKLGVAKTWRHVQDTDIVQGLSKGKPDLGLYCNFNSPAADAERHQRLLYSNMFHHMYERDLISKDQCKAYCAGDFTQPPPEEALIHILQFLNGHVGLKAQFPEAKMGSDTFKSLQECVSVRRMLSVSVMVPYYSETVLFPTNELRDGLLRHLHCLWPAEWRIFCDRTFFGRANANAVLEAFENGEICNLWIACREQYEDECFKCRRGARKERWGTHWWRFDPPPPSLVDDPEVHREMLPLLRPPAGAAAAAAAQQLLNEPVSQEWRKAISRHSKDSHQIRRLQGKYRINVQYWIELQVRLWASLRGQTLARVAYGLHDMREAVCDMAYFECKSASPHARQEEYAVPLTERSTVLDVCAWVHQGAGELDGRWLAEGERRGSEEEMVTASSRRADLLVFACRYWRLDGTALVSAVQEHPVSPRWGIDGRALESFKEMLNDRGFRRRAVEWCIMWFPVAVPDAPDLDDDGAEAERLRAEAEGAAREKAEKAVRAACEHLPDLSRKAVEVAMDQNALREEAEKLVAAKIQFCMGAQAYWANQIVRRATDELLRMDRLRHLELITDRSPGKTGETIKAGWGANTEAPPYATVHVMRKSAATNRTNFLRRFGPPEWFALDGNEQAKLGNDDPKTYMRAEEESEFTFTMFHRQSRLVLGEPKAENQNNIITCARGEVLQVLDMNQDAYYAEGVKLPLVLLLWDSRFNGNNRQVIEETADSLGRGAMARPPQGNGPACGPCGSYHMLGFREHIFTQSHSAVGRYMALAEFSFVTLIQRFLANPHEVRLHYGHPDMVKAAHMKQTGGVSRSSLGVNVNEDIFLGYEMAATGKNVAMIEYISFGKGREVDFNSASVFLKKLSAGAVMQMGSRQVYSLYTNGLWTPQKWALFYGSLAHFVNIYLMDVTIFLFTYVLVIFALADLSPQNFRLLESPLAEPWLIQIGMFYILPMVVERNLERSYLQASDFVLSIPFFAHQNRITASFFGSTMHTGQGKYMGTARGMGYQRTSMVTAFINHTSTNFIPGLRLLLCAAVYYWAGYGCSDCHTTDSDLFRLWIVLISALSYLMAPAFYCPKPTFSAVWREWAEVWAWVSHDMRNLRRRRLCCTCLQRQRTLTRRRRDADGQPDIPTAAAWIDKAKGKGGYDTSMRALWVYEWLEYLNSKGLNAGAAACHFPEAFAVFARELLMIASKYALWAVVPIVAFTTSRGDETLEAKPDGTTYSKEPPKMAEVNWGITAFLVLDVTFLILSELYHPIMRKLDVASDAEWVPRFLRLFLLPILYIIVLLIILLASGRTLAEALATFLFYIVFCGIAFAALTELLLAIAQWVVNTFDRCATSGDPDEACKWRENCRLDVLLFACRWNPLMLFYERLYLFVGLFLFVPNAVLAAFARLHTTWLFNEHVARHDAGAD